MRWLHARSLRRILVALATATAFLATWLLAAPLPAAAGTEDPVAQEQEMLTLVNAERARHGAQPLTMHADLVAASRLHAGVMAGEGRIFHDIEGKRAVAPLGWNRLGENVGTGRELAALHGAFMASPTHAENVLNGEFNWVGIGIVHDAEGHIFVAVAFMAHPPLRAAAAAAVVTPAPEAAPAPRPAPRPPAPVAPVGIAAVPGAVAGGGGFWRITVEGGVFSVDGTGFFGSAAGLRLRRPIA